MMLAGVRVVTVVLNYIHDDDTIRCVESLQASTYLDHQIIVVDNAEDGLGTARLRASLDPDVEVTATGANLGFAGGCNVGIRAALARGAEFVWLVNPDATVDSDALRLLIAAAEEHSDAGVLGSRILAGNSDPAQILFDGASLDPARGGAVVQHNVGKMDADVDNTGVRDVDYVNGACFLIRRSLIRHIGLLPEEYFLYYEETDYCRRAQREGRRTIMVPAARARHFKRSTGRLPEPYYIYYLCRNRIHFGLRYYDITYDALVSEMEGFIGAWRKKIETFAPYRLDRYDDLVRRALEDGRTGRMGRRPDVEDVDLSELSDALGVSP